MANNSNMRGILDSLSASMRREIVAEKSGGGPRLAGALDTKALAAMLPDVTDMPRFVSAVAKVRRGDAEGLTVSERGQLAMAFVSILKGDRRADLKLLRRIAPIEAKN